ncbi:integrin beta-PS-like [Bradysia coprophila]|uniref:integrin beta-PS-like n=1 Tax=Bradysia coprophila TaxID=38358 RepID=UPI00187DC464|nr:integrin beta-PS-like [Bradysia coprophila]
MPKSLLFAVLLLTTFTVNFAQNVTQNQCIDKRICSDCIAQKDCAWCLEPDFGDKPRCFPNWSTSDSCPEEYMYSPVNQQTIIVANSTNDVNGFSVPQIYPQRINLKLRPNEEHRLNVRYTQNDTLSTLITMQDTASSAVGVKYYSSCLRYSHPIESSTCDGLTAGDVVNFQAAVIVTECPSDPKDWFQTFQIYPVGINESLTVDLEMRCGCPL